MKRLIAFCLTVGMLISAMVLAPASIAAKTAEPQVTRVREVKELREKNADTYLLSDGSYECVVYAEDKYFKDSNGELTEINNSIIRTEYSGK